MDHRDAEVTLDGEPVLGILSPSGVAEFRSIPYAERPAAWEAPLALRLESPFDARGFGPVPPQPGAPAGDTMPGSYLTVTVRAPWPPEQPRPVLVWLCVGGNIVGRPDAPHLLNSQLAQAGIITATVTARLGPAGFAVVDDAADNRAARDWLAALQWIREHIAAFGGDPEAITLGGQSAGGGAVAALLTSPAAGGLFQRALVMSSATPSTARQLAREATLAFAAHLDVDATAAAISAVPYERLVAEIAESYGPRWRVADPTRRIRNMKEGPPFRVVDDAQLGLGAVIPALRDGAAASIPILIGSTAEEFTRAFDPLSDSLQGSALAAAFEEIGPGGAERIGDYRARMPSASAGELVGQAFTDAVFRTTPARIARARGDAAAPSYLYEFGPFTEGPSASHGVDVPAVFGAPSHGVPSLAATRFHAAVAQFITSGNPGWDPWSDSRSVARFGDGSVTAGDELDRIDSDWTQN